jgi:hypothetical protein
VVAVGEGITKAAELAVLRGILPEGREVRLMLDTWAWADQRYWGGLLRPPWFTSGIEPYGRFLGSWHEPRRTLNVIPTLFKLNHAGPAAKGIVTHECCHQAQHQLYEHLNQAKGPKRWTDSSHRCPAWSRAVEDVVLTDGLGYFCPVWHRSTGNVWHPWVPASDDWMAWKKAKPDDLYQGRRLMGLEQSRGFAPGVDLKAVIQDLGLNGEDGWGI